MATKKTEVEGAQLANGWVRRLVPWLIALIAIISVLAAGEIAALRESKKLSDEIHRELEVQALALRGTISRYMNIPYLAAQHLDVQRVLQHPDDPALVLRVNRYLEEINRRVGSDALYLMDDRGQTLTASNWHETKPYSFVGDNYAFRPYFKDAIAGGNGFFYAVGSSTGVPGLYISVPVRELGKPVGVVAIKVSLQEIEETWRRGSDPVFLVDDHGIVFLSSIFSWTYRATQSISPSQLGWILDNAQYGPQKEFSLLPWKVERQRGEPAYAVTSAFEDTPREFLVLDESLPEFNWTLGVMKDLAPVHQMRWFAMALTSSIEVTVAMLVLFWRQRDRRFVHQRNAKIELERQIAIAVKELETANAFRKAMEDSLLVGMRARDLEGRIIYVNPALSDITGYSPDELLGKLAPYPYWHPDDMEKHWQDNATALSGKASETGFESRIRHRDGRDVFTMIYTAPLIDSDGKHSGWMSSVVDITAQKAAEEQQRQQIAKMQRTGRMASMGEMASTLAHELGNPLMSISSYAATAKAYAQKGHQELLLETLGEIGEQSQRAAEIVRRIRGFVRQNTPGFSDCAVNEVVANVLSLVRPELRHQRAKVITHLAANLPVIQADKLLLEQVLLNLVVNAVQAMQEKFPAEKIVQIDTGLQDGAIFIRVLDCGPGIPDEVAKQLFAPFFTTKPEGLGLGLNICRTTVEAHRGSLVFENRPEGGASFTVLLPLSP